MIETCENLTHVVLKTYDPLPKQFEDSGEQISHLKELERDLTWRGRVFAFVSFRRESFWLRNHPKIFALSIVNQVVNVLFIFLR
jgi:hypothetical protein